MKRIMDPLEVCKYVFNRNIDNDIIKGTMIDVAQEDILSTYLGEFYIKILDNSETYMEYIDMYLKPMVAWNVLYMYWDFISYNMTDKGLVAHIIDNTSAFIGRDNKIDAKMEIKRNIYILVKQILKIFENEKKKGNELFSDFEIVKIPSIIKYKSGPKKISDVY